MSHEGVRVCREKPLPVPVDAPPKGPLPALNRAPYGQEAHVMRAARCMTSHPRGAHPHANGIALSQGEAASSCRFAT